MCWIQNYYHSNFSKVVEKLQFPAVSGEEVKFESSLQCTVTEQYDCLLLTPNLERVKTSV